MQRNGIMSFNHVFFTTMQNSINHFRCVFLIFTSEPTRNTEKRRRRGGGEKEQGMDAILRHPLNFAHKQQKNITITKNSNNNNKRI